MNQRGKDHLVAVAGDCLRVSSEADDFALVLLIINIGENQSLLLCLDDIFEEMLDFCDVFEKGLTSWILFTLFLELPVSPTSK